MAGAVSSWRYGHIHRAGESAALFVSRLILSWILTNESGSHSNGNPAEGKRLVSEAPLGECVPELKRPKWWVARLQLVHRASPETRSPCVSDWTHSRHVVCARRPFTRAPEKTKSLILYI